MGRLEISHVRRKSQRSQRYGLIEAKLLKTNALTLNNSGEKLYFDMRAAGSRVQVNISVSVDDTVRQRQSIILR